jgi:hypothetical protein
MCHGLQNGLDPELSKVIVPGLVMGTKEKNTVVRTNSELALVALLQLRKGDTYVKVHRNSYLSKIKKTWPKVKQL